MRLVIAAALIAVVLGITVGVISAIRQYTLFDYGSTFLAFLFFAMPVFWFAVLLKEFGAIKLNNWLQHPGLSVLVGGDHRRRLRRRWRRSSSTSARSARASGA